MRLNRFGFYKNLYYQRLAELSLALSDVDNLGEYSSDRFARRSVCLSAFRQGQRTPAKYRICSQGIAQIRGSYRVDMLSYRVDISALKWSGQRPPRILRPKICQSAFNQWQKHLPRAPPRQATRIQHLNSDIEQDRHVWRSHQRCGVIERLSVGGYAENLCTQIVNDRSRQAHGAGVAFNRKKSATK